MALRTPLGAEGADEGPARFEDLWADRDVLHGYCSRIVGDTALAEDMVQEAYTEAFVQLDRLERRTSFLPWLATVAKRRGLNELRRYHYSTPVETIPETGDLDVDPADLAAVRDQVRLLREALTTLTERERALLMRQVNQGKSIGELALEEDSTPASVRSVLLRARAKLRAQIEDGLAWLLLPVTGLADWTRRRLGALSSRAAESGHVTGAAYQFGEVVAAAVVATTLAGGPAALVGSGPDLGPRLFQGAGLLTYAADVSETAAPLPVRHRSAQARSEVSERPAGLLATPAAFGGWRPAEDDPASPAPTGGPAGAPVTPPSTSPPPGEHKAYEEPAQDPEDVHFSNFSAVTPGSTGVSATAPTQVFALGRSAKTCSPACATLLLHSPDGGATWKRLPAEGLGSATALLIAPSYPNDPRIYAMGPGGLRLSTDGGAHFWPVSGEPYEGPVAMSPLFSQGDERILVGSAPPWVYDARRDVVSPFTAAPMTGVVNYFAFAPDYGTSRLLFAGTAVSGPAGVKRTVVHRCADDDCDRGVELPGQRAAPRLVVSSRFAEDGTVFAWVEDDLFVSGDRGASFQKVETGVPGAITGIVDDGRGNAYAAVFDQFGEAGGLLWSGDAGHAWELRGQGTALDRGVQTFVTLPDGTLLAAPVPLGGSGFLCSPDQGMTWKTRCR